MSVGAARKLLNVSPGATEEDITRAFRKMSVQWHPDKYKGDPKEALDMQTKLNEAREVLSQKRKKSSRDVEAEVRAEKEEAKRAREAKRAAKKAEQAEERVFTNRGEGAHDGGSGGRWGESGGGASKSSGGWTKKKKNKKKASSGGSSGGGFRDAYAEYPGAGDR